MESEKSIGNRKMREFSFHVIHDLRTHVFMAYERALYIPKA